MKKLKTKNITTITVILAAIIVFISVYRSGGKENLYYVKQAIDGDTILLATGERVRYIGINTPETKHPYKTVEYFGKEASLYNKKLVEGEWVKLEFDVERRDKYNRLLAYVYVGDTFVNAKLVEDGCAQVYTIPPNVKYQEFFLKLQREAREKKKGLWGRP